MNAESVSSSTSHPWATFCIHDPMFEISAPAQNSRKPRSLNAASMLPRPVSIGTGAPGGTTGSLSA
jgi:hypothetical protein